jgi:hypothetical protein
MAGGSCLDVAVEVELQCDRSGPKRARGGHLDEARNLAELLLERRCDRRRNGLGIGARQLGCYREGRIIHVRQRRDRQQRVGCKAEQQQADHQH